MPDVESYLERHKRAQEDYTQLKQVACCLRRVGFAVEPPDEVDFECYPTAYLKGCLDTTYGKYGIHPTMEIWPWLEFFSDKDSRLFAIFMRPTRGSSKQDVRSAVLRAREEFVKLLAPRLKVDDLRYLYESIKGPQMQGNFPAEIAIAAEFLRRFPAANISPNPGPVTRSRRTVPLNDRRKDDDRLRKFDDAMQLLQLRQEIPSVLRFFRAFDLFGEEVASVEAVCNELQGIKEIELDSSRQHLHEIGQRLRGLLPWMVAYMGSTCTARPFADFFLERKDFGAALNMVWENLQGNEDALDLLHRVESVYKAMRPVLGCLKAAGKPALADFVRALGSMTDDFGDGRNGVDLVLNAVACIPDLLARIAEIRAFFERILLDSSDNVGKLVGRYLSHGVLTSHLARSEVGSCLRFFERRPAGDFYVSEAYLREFVHGLALYERPDAARGAGSDMGLFVQIYLAATRIHELRLRLEALGHPGCQREDALCFRIELRNDPQLRVELKEKERELTGFENEWNKVVREAQAEYPRLLFLEPRQLSRFLELLLVRDETSAQLLLPFVRLCFVDHFNSEHIDGQFRVQWVDVAEVEEALAGTPIPQSLSQTPLFEKYCQQLRVVGPLLEGVQRLLEESEPICGTEQPVRVYLAYNCTEADIFSMLMIDGTTPLPPPFVLNCRLTTAICEPQVIAFLERSRSFPTLPCYILGAEHLSSAVRAAVLQWLHLYRDAKLGSINIIFTGQQGADAFIGFCPTEVASGIAETPELAGSLKAAASQQLQLRQVARFECVRGGPRTGKTYYVTQECEELERSKRSISFRVAVNEDFSPRSVISLLAQDRDPEIPGLAFHFNCSAYCDYIGFANFLQELLFFGLVCDHDTGDLTLLPPMKLYVFVEITPAPETETGRFSGPATVKMLPIVQFGARLVECYARPLVSLADTDARHSKLHRAYRWYRAWREGQLGRKIVAELLDAPALSADEASEERKHLFGTYLQKRGLAELQLPADQRSFELLFLDRFIFLEEYYAFARNETRASGHRLSHFIREGGIQKPDTIFERFLYEAANFAQRDVQARVSDTTLKLSVRAHENDGPPTLELIEFQLNELVDIEQEANGGTIALTYLQACNEPARLRVALGPLLGIRNTAIVADLLKEAKYLLTPDALIKNVLLHEKRKAGQNAVIVGDTGLGKTMMLRLLSLLMNADCRVFPQRRSLVFEWLRSQLYEPSTNYVRREFLTMAHVLTDNEDTLLAVAENLFTFNAYPQLVAPESQLFNTLRSPLLDFIQETLLKYPLIKRSGGLERVACSRAQRPPSNAAAGVQLYSDAELAPDAGAMVGLLSEFLYSGHVELWKPLLISPRISPTSFRLYVEDVVGRAREVTQMTGREDITIVAFLDEFNTTQSLMGSIKEIFCDHSFQGQALPTNIFWVAAMNPQSTHKHANATDFDFTGVQSANLEFIVRPAPLSMTHLQLDFGQLDQEQEKQFTQELLRQQPAPIEHPLPAQLIDHAQQFLRRACLSRIHVSLRDIIRVRKLHHFFSGIGTGRNCGQVFLAVSSMRDKEGFLRWMPALMALALGYYFRLPERHEHDLTRSTFAAEVNGILSRRREYPDSLRREGFVKLVQSCLDGFFRETQVPPGTAPTQSLLENIFAIAVCSQLPLPLLIVGPPGCSKTLAFTIAVSNMRGADSISPAYQKMLPIWSSRYQCSEQSTDAEIKTIYDNAIHKQQKDPHTAGVVFMDEAGLTPEEEMPLKAIHYELDRGEICSVLLSNKVLDAAKTNRTLQLIHGPPSASDITKLAWSCLFGNENPEDIERHCIVEALCNGFWGVCEATAHGSFELRDFIHFLRQIRDNCPNAHNFHLDPKIVAKALQTNFGGGSFEKFCELVATPFLQALAKFNPDLFALVAVALEELKDGTVELLRECLQQKIRDDEDPNSSAIRNVMIIDPADAGAALQTLFDLRLLDQEKCRVMHIAAFQDDATESAKGAAVARIKRSMALGETVVLLNSLSVQSSFYDVFNRHFRKVESHGGHEVAYFANVAIGSLSTSCRVHKDFRVIVIFAESQIPVVPLPLRSRFARFRLSASHVLERQLQHRNYFPVYLEDGRKQPILQLIGTGLQQMVQQLHHQACGGQLLYGMHDEETVASLLLRIDEATSSPDVTVVVPPTVAMSDGALARTESSALDVSAMDIDEANDSIVSRFQQFVRCANFRLLQTARPERFFSCRLFPAAYVQELLQIQEHFSLTRFLPKLLDKARQDRLPTSTLSRKWIIFSRSSEEFHRLPTSDTLQQALLNHHKDDAQCHALGAVGTADSCEGLVSDFYRSPFRTLVLPVDAAVCSSARLGCLRYLVDKHEAIYRSKLDNPAEDAIKIVVVLVHLPPELLFTKHAHVVYTGGWDYAYVDTFGARLTEQGVGDGANRDLALIPEADVRTWILRAYGDKSAAVSPQSLFTAFRAVLQSMVQRHSRAIRRNTFKMVEKQLSARSKPFFLGDRSLAELDLHFVFRELLIRFAEAWNCSLLFELVEATCTAIMRGEAVGSMESTLLLHLGHVLEPMVVDLLRLLVEDCSVDRLLASEGPNASAVQLFVVTLVRMIPLPNVVRVFSPDFIPTLIIPMPLKSLPKLPCFRRFSGAIDELARVVLERTSARPRNNRDLAQALEGEVQRSCLRLHEAAVIVGREEELLHCFINDFIRHTLNFADLPQIWVEFLSALLLSERAEILSSTQVVTEAFFVYWLQVNAIELESLLHAVHSVLLPISHFGICTGSHLWESALESYPRPLLPYKFDALEEWATRLSVDFLWRALKSKNLTWEETKDWFYAAQCLLVRLGPLVPALFNKFDSALCWQAAVEFIFYHFYRHATNPLALSPSIAAYLDDVAARINAGKDFEWCTMEMALRLCVDLLPSIAEDSAKVEFLTEVVGMYVGNAAQLPEDVSLERFGPHRFETVCKEFGSFCAFGFVRRAERHPVWGSPVLQKATAAIGESWKITAGAALLHGAGPNWLDCVEWFVQSGTGTLRNVTEENGVPVYVPPPQFNIEAALASLGDQGAREHLASIVKPSARNPPGTDDLIYYCLLQHFKSLGAGELCATLGTRVLVPVHNESSARKVARKIASAALNTNLLRAAATILSSLTEVSPAHIDEVLPAGAPELIKRLQAEAEHFSVPNATLVFLCSFAPGFALTAFLENDAALGHLGVPLCLHMKQNSPHKVPQFQRFCFTLPRSVKLDGFSDEHRPVVEALAKVYAAACDTLSRPNTGPFSQLLKESDSRLLRMVIPLACYYGHFSEGTACSVLLQCLRSGELVHKLQLSPVETEAITFLAEGPKAVPDETDQLLSLFSRCKDRQQPADKRATYADLMVNCLAVALACPPDSTHLFTRIFSLESLASTKCPGSDYQRANYDCGFRMEGHELTCMSHPPVLGNNRRHRLALNALIWLPHCMAAVLSKKNCSTMLKMHHFINSINDAQSVGSARRRDNTQLVRHYLLQRAGTFIHYLDQEAENVTTGISATHFLSESLLQLFLHCHNRGKPESRPAALRGVYNSVAECVEYEDVMRSIFETVQNNVVPLRRCYLEAVSQAEPRVVFLQQCAEQLRRPGLGIGLVPSGNAFEEHLGTSIAQTARPDVVRVIWADRRLDVLRYLSLAAWFRERLRRALWLRVTDQEAHTDTVAVAISRLQTIDPILSAELTQAFAEIRTSWKVVRDTLASVDPCPELRRAREDGQQVQHELDILALNDETLLANVLGLDPVACPLVRAIQELLRIQKEGLCFSPDRGLGEESLLGYEPVQFPVSLGVVPPSSMAASALTFQVPDAWRRLRCMGAASCTLEHTATGPKIVGFKAERVRCHALIWMTNKAVGALSLTPFCLRRGTCAQATDTPMRDGAPARCQETVLLRALRETLHEFHQSQLRFCRSLTDTELGAIKGALRLGQREELLSVCSLFLDLLKGLNRTDMELDVLQGTLLRPECTLEEACSEILRTTQIPSLLRLVRGLSVEVIGEMGVFVLAAFQNSRSSLFRNLPDDLQIALGGELVVKLQGVAKTLQAAEHDRYTSAITELLKFLSQTPVVNLALASKTRSLNKVLGKHLAARGNILPPDIVQTVLVDEVLCCHLVEYLQFLFEWLAALNSEAQHTPVEPEAADAAPPLVYHEWVPEGLAELQRNLPGAEPIVRDFDTEDNVVPAYDAEPHPNFGDVQPLPGVAFEGRIDEDAIPRLLPLDQERPCLLPAILLLTNTITAPDQVESLLRSQHRFESFDGAMACAVAFTLQLRLQGFDTNTSAVVEAVSTRLARGFDPRWTFAEGLRHLLVSLGFTCPWQRAWGFAEYCSGCLLTLENTDGCERCTRISGSDTQIAYLTMAPRPIMHSFGKLCSFMPQMALRAFSCIPRAQAISTFLRRGSRWYCVTNEKLEPVPNITARAFEGIVALAFTTHGYEPQVKLEPSPAPCVDTCTTLCKQEPELQAQSITVHAEVSYKDRTAKLETCCATLEELKKTVQSLFNLATVEMLTYNSIVDEDEFCVVQDITEMVEYGGEPLQIQVHGEPLPVQAHRFLGKLSDCRAAPLVIDFTASCVEEVLKYLQSVANKAEAKLPEQLAFRPIRGEWSLFHSFAELLSLPEEELKVGRVRRVEFGCLGARKRSADSLPEGEPATARQRVLSPE
eukprot:TRINITY_DN6586_c0_g1_i1.p1 TRINITY_DN6586_c0_g1~~TRINITY_DN6586_c0_g1_i1.p1  ORF type:complete len:5323 (-),score=769.64 TRINITY_DN6586_c0_g1_i1:76-13977(-)